MKHIVYNGTESGFRLDVWKQFAEKVSKLGFTVSRDHTIPHKRNPDLNRLECCDMYLGADIVVSFRDRDPSPQHALQLKGPTKLNAAGSFMIPTVAYPEPAFTQNCYGDRSYFVGTETIDQMVRGCVMLRDDSEFYRRIAAGAYAQSKMFHIDRVVEWYKKLFVGVKVLKQAQASRSL